MAPHYPPDPDPDAPPPSQMNIPAESHTFPLLSQHQRPLFCFLNPNSQQ